MDFDDIWDSFLDAPSSIWEGITSIFENISDFSITGLVIGFAMVGMIFILSNYTLKPFLIHMNLASKIITSIITYIGGFIVGYFMGVFYENN